MVRLEFDLQSIAKRGLELRAGNSDGNRTLVKQSPFCPTLCAAGELLPIGHDIASDRLLETFIGTPRRLRGGAVKFRLNFQRGGDCFVQSAIRIRAGHLNKPMSRRDDDSVGGVLAVMNQPAAGGSADDFADACELRREFLEITDGHRRVAP